YDVLDSFTFRITRNADFDVQEEGAEDLLSVIEDYLKRRKNGVAVRLEVEETQPQNVTLLRDALGLLERDVYQISGPLDLTLLAKLADKLEERFPDLRYPSFTPIIPNELLSEPIYALADRQD